MLANKFIFIIRNLICTAFLFLSFSLFADTHKIHDIENDLFLIKAEIENLKKNIATNKQDFKDTFKESKEIHLVALTNIEKSTQYELSASKKALESSKDAVSFFKDMYMLSTALISVIVGVGTYFGFTNYKAISTKYEEKISELTTNYTDKARALSISAHTQMTQAAEVYIDMGIVKNKIDNYWSKYVDTELIKLDPQFKSDLTRKKEKEAILFCLDKLITDSIKIDYLRLVSWAYTKKALIFYTQNQYEKALEAQENSLEHQHEEFNWSDRYYNLACLSALIYQKTLKTEHKNNAINAFEELKCIVSKKEIDKLLADKDFKVFAETMELVS